MQAVKIKNNVFWVGAIDWNLRNFHGYTTQKGSTYNAYLIIDEKITLIDTVKHGFEKEMIERISSVISPFKIDYIISNHVEPDHSGGINSILTLAPNATVFTSFPSGQKGLTAYYGDKKNYKPVKSGDTLSLGAKTLKFVATPMVHWPDNMVSYLIEDEMLFSNDAFGQHYASNERIDCDNKIYDIYHEAEKYYANIVQPYSKQVKKAVEIVKTLKLAYICPSHGVIWKDNIQEILKFYTDWSDNIAEERAVIIYDTMWHATEKMVRAIEDAFLSKGIPTKIYFLQDNHASDIMTDLRGAKYLAIGSPTLNNMILPTVGGFLTYLKGLCGANNHKFIAFGSYGWSGQSADIIYKELESIFLTPLMPAIKQLYMPTTENLNELRQSVINALEQFK